jgi:uncharacterized protein YjbJ (UPF0337 family)
MNSDQLEGRWKQVKGDVREKWGKLTDNDIQIVGGRRDQLIGRVQERYESEFSLTPAGTKNPGQVRVI